MKSIHKTKGQCSASALVEHQVPTKAAVALSP